MLREYAEKELTRAGLKEEYDGLLYEQVLELVNVFEKQKHSGYSAKLVLDAFQRVAQCLPLVALQGTPDEWVEVAEGLWQNCRCSSVFKDEKLYNGQAYDIDGRLFSTDNGKTWYRSGREGDLLITFPYTPGNPEYVIIPPEEDVSAESDVDGVCEFVED